MVITWGDVTQWDPEPLNAAAADLNTRYTKLVAETETDVRKIAAIEGWHGEAASAAATEGNAIADALESYAADIAALRRACADTSDAIVGVKHGVAEAEGLATAQRFTINADNSITDHGPSPDTPPDQLAGVSEDRKVKAVELAERVAQVLRTATDVNDDCCVVLKRIVANQTIDPTGNDNTHTSLAAAGNAGHAMGSLSIPSPPVEGATAAQNAAYWATLSDAQRTRLATDHPGLVGPRDGFTAVHRDIANRQLLGRERARLREAVTITNPDRELVKIKHLASNKAKLEALDKLAGKLDQPDQTPENQRYYLLGLDTNQDGTLILAKGTPDTARHVATFVPGTGTELAGIDGNLARGDAIHAAAGRAAPGESTSVITWAGYDAPDHFLSASDPDYAIEAKDDLGRFQDGLRESHQGPPAHTSTIGYSYGSLVTGLAARDGHMQVDDLINVGSPGTGTYHANQLHMPTTHVWSTAAENDPVSGLERFGADPADPRYGGQTFTSNPGPSGPLFGNSFDAHKQYFYDDPYNPALRNMGDIITGRPPSMR